MIAEDGERYVRRLHEQHGAALYGWARSRFADARDAEEVVAETLTKAWRGRDRFDDRRGTERAWLFAIARNAAVDHHRRGGAALRLVPDGAVAGDLGPVEADHSDRIAEATVVAEALAGLPEHHRQVIADTYLHGLTTSEVAVRRGLAPGTVKSRLFYGLRALRAVLEEQGVLR